MSVLQEVLKANAGYAAAFGVKSKLTIPPARHFTILTCMEGRTARATRCRERGLPRMGVYVSFALAVAPGPQSGPFSLRATVHGDARVNSTPARHTASVTARSAGGSPKAITVRPGSTV